MFFSLFWCDVDLFLGRPNLKINARSSKCISQMIHKHVLHDTHGTVSLGALICVDFDLDLHLVWDLCWYGAFFITWEAFWQGLGFAAVICPALASIRRKLIILTRPDLWLCTIDCLHAWYLGRSHSLHLLIDESLPAEHIFTGVSLLRWTSSGSLKSLTARISTDLPIYASYICQTHILWQSFQHPSVKQNMFKELYTLLQCI